MKTTFSLLLLASSLLLRISAVEELSLNEKLQPLQPYMGNWNVCWTDSAGRHLSGKASLRLEAEGSMVKFTLELMKPPGRGSYARWALFYWDTDAL